MRVKSLMLACAMLSGAAALAPQASAASDPAAGPSWAGVWANGNNRMHVRAARCGEAMCGTVVWADDKMKQEVAARGRSLVGAQVFRDFRQIGPNQWKGLVYIPAIDKTVSGKIELNDSESITASACMFGPVGCQTRHYKRIR